jgi:hypothetical protein
LIAGGGFIGGHLVAEFIRRDIRTSGSWTASSPPIGTRYFPQVENVSADLRELPACHAARVLWGTSDRRWGNAHLVRLRYGFFAAMTTRPSALPGLFSSK